MTVFVYEVEDRKGGSSSVELTLPFSGEWRQKSAVANGDLSSDCILYLNAEYIDNLVSSIFELEVKYEIAFEIIINRGEIVDTDFQFEIVSDYNFDRNNEIRSKFIEKIESGYSIDSVLIS